MGEFEIREWARGSDESDPQKRSLSRGEQCVKAALACSGCPFLSLSLSSPNFTPGEFYNSSQGEHLWDGDAIGAAWDWISTPG